MNPLILTIGVLGVVIATWFFMDLAIDAIRRREFLDLVIATLLLGAVVWAIVAYGDRLMR